MRIELDSAEEGVRLDLALSSLQGVGSRSQAERLIRAGQVLVNGEKAPKSYRTRRGDVIEIPDRALDDAPVQLEPEHGVPVLWEDEFLLVVDKPAGMVVHPAPGHKEPTLVERLSAGGVDLAPDDDPVMERPGVVHRLDRQTSGLLVLAKDRASMRALQDSMRERSIRREYLALVDGLLPSRAGRIEAPIGPDSRDGSRRSIDTRNPQNAITHFSVSELLPTTTLVRAWLETGRTHQIRVHFQSIGHHVVGDPTYGGRGEFGLKRQFLHAALLRFPHPKTQEEIEVTSPLPDDLHDALVAASSVH